MTAGRGLIARLLRHRAAEPGEPVSDAELFAQFVRAGDQALIARLDEEIARMELDTLKCRVKAGRLTKQLAANKFALPDAEIERALELKSTVSVAKVRKQGVEAALERRRETTPDGDSPALRQQRARVDEVTKGLNLARKQVPPAVAERLKEAARAHVQARLTELTGKLDASEEVIAALVARRDRLQKQLDAAAQSTGTAQAL